MRQAAQAHGNLFEGGPPLRLQRRLGVIPQGPAHIGRRAWLTVLLTWAPLLLLTAVQAALGKPGLAKAFLCDLSVHARLLVAAPLLVIADGFCARRLEAIALHFLDAGLVRDEQVPRYRELLASTARLRDSPLAEFIVIASSYFLMALTLLNATNAQLPDWYRTDSGLSWAIWWYGLVSLPLVLTLLLGWAWRLVLWTRLLAGIARLDLRLIPVHPDRAAGLRFVGYSLRAFSILAFAIGAMSAGAVANGVVFGGLPLSHFAHTIIGIALLAVVIFCGPLLLLLPTLAREWRRGIFQYGELADRFGREFERKWFDGRGMDQGVLEMQDFSAATDTYQTVGNVYEMRLMPFELKSVALLVAATLLPYLPVVLLAIPIDTLMSMAANLLM
ncbi:MAG TPA: hypothetical protein VHB46_06700 [Burkholderiales bacterium]|nr:hypothetical protein [Burkholderiales bacterium]